MSYEAALKVGLCASIAEVGISYMLSRTMSAEANMIQRISVQRAQDSMGNAVYTGMVTAAGVLIASLGLRIVRVSPGGGSNY